MALRTAQDHGTRRKCVDGGTRRDGTHVVILLKHRGTETPRMHRGGLKAFLGGERRGMGRDEIGTVLQGAARLQMAGFGVGEFGRGTRVTKE